MTVGYGPRRSSAAGSDHDLAPREARILREADALGRFEMRISAAGRREFRIPGSRWMSIEDVARWTRGPMQLAALDVAKEEA